MKKYFNRIKQLFAFTWAIGVMAATCFAGCASENQFGLREKNDENMVKLASWGLVASTVEVNKIALTGEEGSEFVCSTSSNDPQEEGVFILNIRSSAASVTVSSGSSVYWSNVFYDDENYMSTAQKDTIWLEFINRKDSHTIGYAVVKVIKIDEIRYEAEVMKSVTFPKSEGKYQDVTNEQINRLIADVEK